MNQLEDRYTRRNRALAFAVRAHRDQLRKGTKDLRKEDQDDVDKLLGSSVPYIMHPAAVGMLLLEHQTSDDVVIAGILHDVLEDTDVTKEVLQQTFGAEVLRLVTAASEPDKTLPWLPRKEHTIEHLATADVNVKFIAAADKLHNVQSIQLDLEKIGERVWERFNPNAPKEAQAWYYHSICEALTAGGSSHKLFERLRESVVSTFGEEKPPKPGGFPKEEHLDTL